jgi:DNA-binding CsgD family transcriptional regulator
MITHKTGGLWKVVEPLVDEIDGASYMARARIVNAASALALWRAEYEKGRRIAEQARSLQREYGVTSPFALVRIAVAQLGLRDFDGARRTIEEVRALSRENVMLDNEIVILRARLNLCEQGPEAMLRAMGAINESHRPAGGEYHALRAIASAAIGDRRRARSEIAQATRASRAVDVALLARFAALIDRIQDGAFERELSEAVALLREADAADCLDGFVIAYRAFPALLRLYALDPWASELMAEVAVRANDHLPGGAASDLLRANGLTPRERQIYGLLADGMSNKEIAARLAISVHTTKIHVHHILAKLGVRDRIAAMRIATTPGSRGGPT